MRWSERQLSLKGFTMPTILACVAGLLLFVAGTWFPGDSDVCPPPSTVTTVFIPADESVCPEEDSCRVDFRDGVWVLEPVGDGQ